MTVPIIPLIVGIIKDIRKIIETVAITMDATLSLSKITKVFLSFFSRDVGLFRTFIHGLVGIVLIRYLIYILGNYPGLTILLKMDGTSL
jgi:hypothetical protein